MSHLFFMTVTCKGNTKSLYCVSPTPQVPPPAPLLIVYMAAVAAVNHTHSDILIAMVMCVTASERHFIEVCHAVRPAWCIYQRAIGHKNRHSAVFTFSLLLPGLCAIFFNVSGVCPVDSDQFIIYWRPKGNRLKYYMAKSMWTPQSHCLLLVWGYFS